MLNLESPKTPLFFTAFLKLVCKINVGFAPKALEFVAIKRNPVSVHSSHLKIYVITKFILKSWVRKSTQPEERRHGPLIFPHFLRVLPVVLPTHPSALHYVLKGFDNHTNLFLMLMLMLDMLYLDLLIFPHFLPVIPSTHPSSSTVHISLRLF